MFTLDQLQTFNTVATLNNFNKAANKLGISAAAVGKQIKQLENTIGIQLFYRTTRHVSVTEFGKVFLQKVQHIVEDTSSLASFIEVYKGEVSGHLRIVSSITFGKEKIIPLLEDFLTTHKKVTVHLELADRIPDLEKEDIDIVIGLRSGAMPDHMICRKIGDLRYGVFAKANYFANSDIPQKPEQLINCHYIAHEKRPSPEEIYFTNGASIRLNPRLYLNNTSAIIQACLANVGIIWVDYNAVEEYLNSGEIIEILTEYAEPPAPIYLYYRNMNIIEPKVRHFIDMLCSVD